MIEMMSPGQREALRRSLAEELLRHGPEMGAGREQDAAILAREWAAVGCDLDEMRDALDARCFEPRSWRALRDAGLGASTIGRRVRVLRGDYDATIGYAVSNGDMTIREAACQAYRR